MWEPGLIFDWACTLFEMFALAFLSLRRCDVSTKVSLGLWIFSSVIMQLVTAQIYLWCKSYPEQTYAIWYGSWIIFNAFSLWIVLLMHQMLKASTSSFTKLVSASFFVLTILQIAGFVDRAILETKVLDELYRFMIIGINFAIVPAVAAELWKNRQQEGALS